MVEILTFRAYVGFFFLESSGHCFRERKISIKALPEIHYDGLVLSNCGINVCLKYSGFKWARHFQLYFHSYILTLLQGFSKSL